MKVPGGENDMCITNTGFGNSHVLKDVYEWKEKKINVNRNWWVLEQVQEEGENINTWMGSSQIAIALARPLRTVKLQVLASQKQLENKYKAAQQTADDWYNFFPSLFAIMR